MKKLIIILILLGMVTPVVAAPKPSANTYREAVKLAHSQNKKLFVFFTTNSCGLCRKMKAETLSDSRVEKHFAKYYIVYYVNVDLDKDKEVAFAYRRYLVNGFPTYCFVSMKDPRKPILLKGARGYKDYSSFALWHNAKK